MPCDILTVNDTKYTVLRLLGKGKGGYSYLVTDGRAQYVLKQIHHEPCDYYTFGDKLQSELRDYKTLRTLGIPMPELLAADVQQERILKEYIAGPTVAELLKAGQPDPGWVAHQFRPAGRDALLPRRRVQRLSGAVGLRALGSAGLDGAGGGKDGKRMKVPWEDKLPCAALALLVLAVFYGIYFAKMLAQKRRGIQARQIGRRREKDIHTVEVLMSLATLGAPIAQLLSIAFGWSHLPANARFTGFCIGMLGDAVFLLSVLCMKDSWRAGIPDKDKTELVTTGIYAFSRNPAFLGFDLMYIGVLLLYGNLLTLGFSLFAMMMLHLQILQEERFLASTFGEPYREYCRRVFRYLGRRKEHK